MRRRIPTRRVLAACRLGVVLLCVAALPRLARSAGPEVTSLFPPGGQRGTTVEVTLKGKFANWPVQAWVDRQGLTVAPAEEKEKAAITVSADAPPGLYWIRLFDATGVSVPRPFVVGSLAEVVELEPNNSADKVQAIPSAAVVVDGRLNSGGDVDHFAVPLKQGQTLVASLAGHEMLGSPMDAVMLVVSEAGYQIAYNHDQRGLDPEIVFQPPADGNYLVRLFAFPSSPNSSISFSGNDRYIYRLTLTTGGFVDYPWPLAVTRSRAAQVELCGWNIPESLKTVTIEPTGESFEIADPQLANPATVAVEPHETLEESEPNEPAAAQAITLPVTLSGRIERPGDVDAFSFEGHKGQVLVFQLESRTLGYPLDGVLEVTDAEGKSLARVDDTGGPDPLVTFTPPADGSYRVVVSDLNGHGSRRHVYRLRAVPAEPSYQVSADSHAYVVSLDKAGEITLSIDRQHGFAEEIAFSATGLPEFVTAAPAKSQAKGDSAKTVKLSLASSGGSFSGPIRIQAQAAGESKLERTATAAIPDHTARITDLWLTVADAEKK